jgi:hypothetical protein
MKKFTIWFRFDIEFGKVFVTLVGFWVLMKLCPWTVRVWVKFEAKMVVLGNGVVWVWIDVIVALVAVDGRVEIMVGIFVNGGSDWKRKVEALKILLVPWYCKLPLIVFN